MPGKPPSNSRVFVRGVVVHDEMQLLVRRGAALEQVQKLQPFLMRVTLLADADDRAIQSVQGSK